MTTDHTETPGLSRMATHVAGLDDILGGGLFDGGVYFVQGLPGAGKTTLASQIAFTHARHGGRVLYVTMLAESHARMLQHMRGHTFFEPDAVAREIAFLSAFQQLEDEGLDGMTQVVLREALRHKASLLVFDGLVTPVDDAVVDRQMRLFVHSLQGFGSLNRCTTLLLTSNGERAQRSERTMVDGILQLVDRQFGPRVERRLQVHKFRGSGVVRGEHSFCITDDGIVVYPRLEASPWALEAPTPLPRDVTASQTPRTVPIGIPGLDAMLNAGGVPAGSVTLLSGPSGVGKTSMALAFAGEARPDAPALMLGFAESATQLAAKARRFGVDLDALRASGALHLRRGDAYDRALDQIGHQLLADVDAHRIARVVVDDLRTLFDTPAWSERGPAFLRGLLDALRVRGVTALFVSGAGETAGASAAFRADDVAASFDNLVDLRFAQHAAGRGAERQISIAKVRDDACDGAARWLRMDDGRLSILPEDGPATGGAIRSKRSPT